MVRAIMVADIENGAGLLPGAFEIVVNSGAETAGMAFRCPCGCGREGYLPFRPEPSPSWSFDGNDEAPTLTPSIQQVGGCRWHGFLTNGEWRSC